MRERAKRKKGWPPINELSRAIHDLEVEVESLEPLDMLVKKELRVAPHEKAVVYQPAKGALPEVVGVLVQILRLTNLADHDVKT